MKKVVSLIAISVMIFGLCACSQTGTAGSKEMLLKKAEDGLIHITASKEALKEMEEMRENGQKYLFTEEGFPLMRATLGGPEELPDVKVTHTLERTECDGFDVYSLSDASYDNIVLYIHGGAWVLPIIPDHVKFCDKLVDTMNAKVYMPFYPMAPNYSYKETYAMLEKLYDELLTQNKPIYIMGDSAGGHLTMMLATIIRDTGRKAPEKLVAFAPCADLTLTNPDIDEIDKIDPMISKYACVECAKMWAKDKELTDPAISPNYADLSNLPDTLMFVGTSDILYPDDMIMYKLMQDAGDEITVVKGEGLPHVYSVSDNPECQTSLDMIKEFCLQK